MQSAEGGEEESGKEGASLDPNYAVSGKLTADTNTYRVNIIMCETIPFDFFLLLQGVVIKYNEPEEARIPKIRWRLYQFKGDETLRTFALVLFSVYVVFVLFIVISIAIATLYIHRQSAYLVGRERKVSGGYNVCVHLICIMSDLCTKSCTPHAELKFYMQYRDLVRTLFCFFFLNGKVWILGYVLCSYFIVTLQICDMPVDHPSCSKQHAVIQYRLVNYTKADGSTGRRVR